MVSRLKLQSFRKSPLRPALNCQRPGAYFFFGGGWGVGNSTKSSRGGLDLVKCQFWTPQDPRVLIEAYRNYSVMLNFAIISALIHGTPLITLKNPLNELS